MKTLTEIFNDEAKKTFPFYVIDHRVIFAAPVKNKYIVIGFDMEGDFVLQRLDTKRVLHFKGTDDPEWTHEGCSLSKKPEPRYEYCYESAATSGQWLKATRLFRNDEEFKKSYENITNFIRNPTAVIEV